MNRYTPQTPRDPRDLQLAKSRLRVAAIQASPAEMVRRHPWASVIGVFSASMAAAALISDRSSERVVDRAARRNISPGIQLPSGLVQWVISTAIQLIQAHLARRSMERAGETQETASEDANAMG